MIELYRTARYFGKPLQSDLAEFLTGDKLLKSGQVGTVIENLDDKTVLLEVSRSDGSTSFIGPVKISNLTFSS